MRLEELIEARDLIIQSIGEKQGVAREALKQEMHEKAAALGIDIMTLFGIARAGRAKGGQSTVAAKYRIPKDHAETWSGRGRQPRWLVRELAEGRRIEDFAI